MSSRRRTGSGSGRATWITLAVFLCIAVALFVPAVIPDDDDEEVPATSTTSTSLTPEMQAAREWEHAAEEAFDPLTTSAFELPRQSREWLGGTRTTEDFRKDVEAAFEDVLDVRGRVTDLPELEAAPLAKEQYRASSLLYVEYVRVYLVAVELEDGDLRDQVVLGARRVRILADRVFDRGRALVVPLLAETPDPNVEINLPTESPDWEAEGVAAGPPLDDEPTPPDEPPPLLEDDRPTQPREAWEADVAAVAVPAAAELAAAVDAAEADALRDLARSLDDAVRQLEPVPDPEGGREDATRSRLALLVHEEAARAAQMLAVGPAGVRDALGPLDAVARRLGLVGDDLWASSGLPERSTGFDSRLLEED